MCRERSIQDLEQDVAGKAQALLAAQATIQVLKAVSTASLSCFSCVPFQACMLP